MGEITSFTCFKPDCDLWFPNSFRLDLSASDLSIHLRMMRMVSLGKQTHCPAVAQTVPS